jgi:hypothetical protein
MASTKWSEIRAAKVPPDQEATVAAGTRALKDALDLRELRMERGITQVELAGRLPQDAGQRERARALTGRFAMRGGLIRADAPVESQDNRRPVAGRFRA